MASSRSNNAVAAQPTTMTAARIVQPRQITMVDVPLPEAGPGQLRIRLEGCGVCASNIPPWEGRPWFSYPMAPGALGHEGWGVVDETGPGVTDIEVGQRVSFLSNHAYAEYDVASVDELIELPNDVNGMPFPGEPLGCAQNIFDRSRVEPGQHVAIIGIGFLGALLIPMALQRGAKVIAISRREWSRQVAAEQGAAHVLPLSAPPELVSQVGELTDGRMCQRVIEATGTQVGLDLGGELTGTRGRLIVAGYHQDGMRQVNMQMWNWKGIDVINAHERDPAAYVAGMLAAVDAVVDGAIQPQELITHRFPLHKLDEALEAARRRPNGFTKAIVTCDGADGEA